MNIFLLFLPAVVFSQCITQDDKQVVSEKDARMALIKGEHKFSIEMLKSLYVENKDQNIFFSPHSIYQSILLAFVIAGNETEKALKEALYLPETQDKLGVVQSYGVQKYFQLTREFNGSTDYEFSSCNKLFLAEDIQPRECMQQILNEEIDTINTTNPDASRKYINEWVEQKTKRHIKDLIPEDGIREDTQMILANAAYFKGLWKSRFFVENTKKNSLFYVSSDDIKIVDLMSQKGTFNHMTSEKLKAHILELPYKGEEISMIIILPRFGDNAIHNLIQQLSEENIQELIDFDALYPKQIEVQIPKFTIEKTINLNAAFQRLGLGSLFNEKADFSGLTEGPNDVRFSDAIHKAKAEVDEEGTVAAAATAIFTFRSSRPLDPTRFIANHPFLFLIYDKLSHSILFLGVYQTPDKKYRNGKKINL